VANLKLRRCADCEKEVSIHAEFCPHCGARFVKKKQRGVFFYVFWGVMSLILTCLLIVTGLLVFSGFLAGFFAAVNHQRETAGSAPPKTAPLSLQERQNAQEILSGLHRAKDQVEGTTWLEPAWAQSYNNQVYLYIGIGEDQDPFLRLKIEYMGTELLMVEKIVFRIDEMVTSFKPSGLVKSDYAAGQYREWVDEPAGPHLPLAETIAKGNNVLMRYAGTRHVHDRTVSEREKASLAQMILVYRHLKEQKGTSP
jgi:hypothetical protein